MNDMWWDILKVDIDFSDEPKGLGHYESWGNMPEFSNIKINHKKIYDFVKTKLGREPTEKELMEYVKRVIMHESTHAAHDAADEEFYWHPNQKKEYVAYMGMFPENPYVALKEFLEHPDTVENADEMNMLALLLGIPQEIKHKEAPAKIVRLLNYVNRWAKTNRQKNKLTRLELLARKELKDWNKDKFPQSAKQMLARYGQKHRKFIYSLEQKPPGGK